MTLIALLLAAALQTAPGTIACRVTHAGIAVPGAEVLAAGVSYRTDSDGYVRLQTASGTVQLVVSKEGFAPAVATVTLPAGEVVEVEVALVVIPEVEESVTVSATRSGRGLDDQPMRVEVLDREEIDEKLLMTPGDVVMMLNEMGGMRVQATSPSLGAASVRIQGMRGRYTRILSDGLPLFGGQVSLGLMQIPPLDLGRAEVIKGAASSLYGSGAMGGVVNLVSRRPGSGVERQVMLNRSSRGASDASVWYSAPLSERWGLTLLGSVNGHSRTDTNADAWADLPRYERVVIRPRVYWDNHRGRSLFATAGGTWEHRAGGSMPGRVLLATNLPYVESLDTGRADLGAAFQSLTAGGTLWSARGSWTSQRLSHQFGDTTERDRRGTGFAEVTARRRVGSHTLVGGIALEGDSFASRNLPQFDYTFTVPGVFVQDDVDVARWLVVSASARADRHSRFGSFVSPHLSTLVRGGAWSGRLSLGSGFFAPTPLTEETEAAGLSRLMVEGELQAERGRTVSFDVTRKAGPLTATLTLFRSTVKHPVEVERKDRFTMANLPEPIINTGLEALTVWRAEGFSFVANYAYVRARQSEAGDRVDVPLTPRHSIGLDAAWEWEGRGRIGVEWFYTGVQRLEANPFRPTSRPYSVFGLLATRIVGKTLLYVNTENLSNVRQTRWDPLLRPSRGPDGRWTVDSWAPLDGVSINGGVRVSF